MDKIVSVGITLGDPNGIGPEIIVKSLSRKSILDKIKPIIYCPEDILLYYIQKFNLNLSINVITSPKQAINNVLNLIDIKGNNFKLCPGKITNEAGNIAFKSLKAASDDLFNSKTDVIVTAPINKDNIQNEDFNFMGHTEYFTSRCKLEESLMLMVHNNLRVGLVTNHLPLNIVSKSISNDLIIKKLTLLKQVLEKDFNINNPKLALLGLNPHSGDNGLIGFEEKEIIIPAIKYALNKNINISGPFPADGFFANNNHINYDGVLAMYHDQGLIPFKVMSRNEGVNFTAGLPIIRTSPDHGTGYDIAGKGVANSTSFENAIIMAKDIFNSRKNRFNQNR